MQIPGLHLAVDSQGSLDELPWRSTRYDGVQWIDLAQGKEIPGDADRGSETVLIRMAPGCGYPAHRHVGAEDVLVLAGGYRDEGRQPGTNDEVFRAGRFVRYAPGSTHAPRALGERGDDGDPCVLFAVAHGGTERLTASESRP